MDQNRLLVAQDQPPIYNMRTKRSATLDHTRSLPHGIKAGITTTVDRPAVLVDSLRRLSKVHGDCCACYPVRAGTSLAGCWRSIPRNVLPWMKFLRISGLLGARSAHKRREELYYAAIIMSILWSLALALLPPQTPNRRNKAVYRV